MNLVQINERLKDLPMQVVQQYANGMNPEVPPYLALGELQRRELSQKQMATAQGAQQGPQPSVKEQVEQKAGLMALQQMQQQQMAQQQAQPQGPMPAPAGVPQPQQQPEVMMARGGLASVPVRSDMFEYAGGGIVAFSGGGEVDAARAELRRALETLRAYGSRQRLQDPEGFKAAEAAVAKAQERRKQLESSYAQEMALGGADRPATSMRDVGRVPELSRQEAPTPAPAPAGRRMSPTEVAKMLQDPYATGKPIAPTTGLPGAAQQMSDKPAPTSPPTAPKPPMAAAPAPAAAPQTGLPGAAAAMSPQDEVAKLSMEAVREKAKAMTPEEAMAQEGKFASQYGLDKKFGEEERGLLALMKQRQAEFAKRRPMEELGATLRGFGQGYGGASAAGERAGRETYEMDMANQREALNAINALNKENLATGKERYKFGSGLFGKSEESAAAANRQRMETLGSMSNKDKEVANAAANRLNNIEVEKLRIAERQAERNQPGSAAKVRAEYLKMMDQVFALEDKGEKAQADALRRRADARLTAGSGSGTAGVGAARNAISERRLEMAGLEKIMKDEAMVYSDEEKKEAAKEYRRLALLNSKESGGSPSGEIDKSNPLLK